MSHFNKSGLQLNLRSRLKIRKRVSVDGKFPKYHGGILLSSILLVGLVSLLLLTLLETTRETIDFSAKTTRFYQANIMKELFYQDYQRNVMPEKGTVDYNIGELSYEVSQEKLNIVCIVDSYRFRYEKSLAKDETSEP